MKPGELAFWRERSLDVAAVALWFVATTGMVFYNKFLLSYYGFHFPIALTLWHMVVSSFLPSALIQLGLVKPLHIPFNLYYTRVFPIAACFAGALWASNAAYTVSSVSFVQMVKAGMPATVFICGLVFGSERFKCSLALDVLLISVGVAIAAFGETHLVVKGLLLLLLSITCEAVRLTLTQKMIQSSGLRFNPITTLYHIAPVASIFLAIPFALLEANGVWLFLSQTRGLWHFVLNGLNAFGLNLSVYLLIGRTSALTMNVSGLVKDWFTIAASVVFTDSIVTPTNLVGYAIAFIGVIWYNFLRLPPLPSQQSDERALELAVALSEQHKLEQQEQQQQLKEQQQQQQHPEQQDHHHRRLPHQLLDLEQQPLLGRAREAV